MRIPRPAAEKLGVDRQDPDLDGLLLGLIRRATGGCHEHAARLSPMYGTGAGRGLRLHSRVVVCEIRKIAVYYIDFSRPSTESKSGRGIH